MQTGILVGFGFASIDLEYFISYSGFSQYSMIMLLVGAARTAHWRISFACYH
jgi:hypothetical protein